MTSLISFFAMLLLGVPVAFVLGAATLIYVYSTGNVGILASMPSKLFNGLQNFGLVAIPMFVLLGEIMNMGGITERLIQFAKTIFGSLRGGLAYVNIAANTFMASIVGSANAQTAIMSKTIVPAMEKEGYEKSFSAALTASSSIVGPLIPPSMPFIIYGVTAGVSIGSLFLAGIIPGLLFSLAFGIAVFIIAKRQNFPKGSWLGWKEALKSTLYVIPALSIPVLIMAGITSGIFTATESAAVAVFVAFIVGAFVYRNLKFKHLPGIFLRTVITTSTVSFLLAASNIFGWVLNFQRIPQLLAEVFLNIADNPIVFLLLINLLLLIVGMFLDGVAALILLTPILLPIAVQFGVDPIHLGAIMVINLTFGLLTPPVGTVLFIASAAAGVKIEALVKRLVPFYVISFVVLMMITYIPQTTLWIPSFFGGK